MNKNKIVGTGLFATFGIMALSIIFADSIDSSLYDSLELLAGIGLWVFGLWAGIILIKQK